MVYNPIIRNEDIRGQFIEPDAEQARLIAEYVKRYKMGLGVEPAGLHWLPELGDYVFLPPPAGLVTEVENYDLPH